MLDTSTSTKNGQWPQGLNIQKDNISVLIIGNNPIEMTSIYNILIGMRTKNYTADVCFDVKDSFDRISRTKPDVIFIDDNLLLDDIRKFLKVIRHNIKTKYIKTILIKSSNWSSKIIDDVDDYILKDTISSENLNGLVQKNLQSFNHQLA